MTDHAVLAPSASATGADTVVSVEGLRKGYRISRQPRDVLAGVSLEVGRGEFVAIMGPSGCGKSTLLHVLGGLEPPDEGRVIIDGRDLYALDDERLAAFRRDHVGLVFQFFNLIPSLTAAENVALPLRLRGRGHGAGRWGSPNRRRVIRDRVHALMDQLDLHGLQGHGPEEISGGEQQRVALARALAVAPSVLLADEPTGNLDWATAHEVMALLARLCRSEDQTTVVVTHDARTAAWADRVLVMRDGAVVDEVRLGRRDTPDPAPLVARLVELGL
ncbi:MAG: ABC transporter ATP-binding protein [Chloroflexi bacterium]|nr:MAG: ABC transporter ATP-binding protein [Chloroflexota bacterium]